jgi:DNA repair protein SbcD/Mre11
MAADIRILFLADSHIGFDLPQRPRVDRHRRGHDFLANYHTALGPAIRGEVDLVIHGGDVFDRSRPLPSTAYRALEPLRRIAASGVPVFIVPGNHERSRIPHARFGLHPNVHLFDRARTFTLDVRGHRIALAGFPYERDNVRARFPDLLRETGWEEHDAGSRLLCVHHCVEGATVGPANFTFTTAADVIRHRDIPTAFRAVLSGHIHRHQVLTRYLGRKISTPVLYAGSIERTSTAELGERKGFMIVTLRDGGISWEFRELPTRDIEISAPRPRTSIAMVTRSDRRSQSEQPRRLSPIEISFSFLQEESEPAGRAP